MRILYPRTFNRPADLRSIRSGKACPNLGGLDFAIYDAGCRDDRGLQKCWRRANFSPPELGGQRGTQCRARGGSLGNMASAALEPPLARSRLHLARAALLT